MRGIVCGLLRLLPVDVRNADVGAAAAAVVSARLAAIDASSTRCNRGMNPKHGRSLSPNYRSRRWAVTDHLLKVTNGRVWHVIDGDSAQS